MGKTHCPDYGQEIAVPGLSDEAFEFELRRHRYPHDGRGCPVLLRPRLDAELAAIVKRAMDEYRPVLDQLADS